jgi:hypothetical protein
MMLFINNMWSIFLVEYEYDDFIHVHKDEFLWLHLQL